MVASVSYTIFDGYNSTTNNADEVDGAGVNEPAQAPVEVAATVPHRAGLGPIGWIVIVLAALVLAAYAAGLFT